MCRDAPTAGYYEIAPTPLPDRTFEFPGQDKISMDITSKFMARTTHYKIQFVAPCLVRYYMPNVRPCCQLKVYDSL